MLPRLHPRKFNLRASKIKQAQVERTYIYTRFCPWRLRKAPNHYRDKSEHAGHNIKLDRVSLLVFVEPWRGSRRACALCGEWSCTTPATNLLRLYPTLPAVFSLRGHVGDIHSRLVIPAWLTPDRWSLPTQPWHEEPSVRQNFPRLV
jgi:hypothetical protein